MSSSLDTSLDTSLGRVRATLADLGLDDNTLLISTSDNGPCSSSGRVDRHMAGLRGLKGTVCQNNHHPIQPYSRHVIL